MDSKNKTGIIIFLSLVIVLLLIVVAQDWLHDREGGYPPSYVETSLDEETSSETGFSPFYVYLNVSSRINHFVPSGFMPKGNCLKLEDDWTQNCYSDETCLRVEYDVACSKEDQKWAGIYWLNPANNWGSRKGGFDLTGATRLTFRARGEKGGEVIEEFLMGGISGDYPDSDSASIGPVILTNHWKDYSIDLRGKDLSYISGGFAWTSNVKSNPENCIFYLDDIRFE